MVDSVLAGSVHWPLIFTLSSFLDKLRYNFNNNSLDNSSRSKWNIDILSEKNLISFPELKDRLEQYKLNIYPIHQLDNADEQIRLYQQIYNSNFTSKNAILNVSDRVSSSHSPSPSSYYSLGSKKKLMPNANSDYINHIISSDKINFNYKLYYSVVTPDDAFLNMINAMRVMLWCGWCRAYFRLHIKLDMPDSKNKTFLKWAYGVKDSVNQRNNQESPNFQIIKIKNTCCTQLTSPEQVWDLIIWICLNYPFKDNNDEDNNNAKNNINNPSLQQSLPPTSLKIISPLYKVSSLMSKKNIGQKNARNSDIGENRSKMLINWDRILSIFERPNLYADELTKNINNSQSISTNTNNSSNNINNHNIYGLSDSVINRLKQTQDEEDAWLEVPDIKASGYTLFFESLTQLFSLMKPFQNMVGYFWPLPPHINNKSVLTKWMILQQWKWFAKEGPGVESLLYKILPSGGDFPLFSKAKQNHHVLIFERQQEILSNYQSIFYWNNNTLKWEHDQKYDNIVHYNPPIIGNLSIIPTYPEPEYVDIVEEIYSLALAD